MIQKKTCQILHTIPLLILLFCLAWGTTAQADGRSYTRSDAEMLARTVWGEARGCDTTQQAAVVWCILNRVGDARFPNSIQGVVTQSCQFSGYQPGNPVDPEILGLVYDVLARWSIEPECVGDVGRVLPADYLYFSGTGSENVFRRNYRDGELWDWSLPSPYGVRPEIVKEIPAAKKGAEDLWQNRIQ